MIVSCANKPIVQTKVTNKTVIKQPRPSPLNLYGVEFYVVTEERFLDFKNRFSTKNDAFVFVSFSIRDYENLAKNMAELERYIKQQQALIEYYEKSLTSK